MQVVQAIHFNLDRAAQFGHELRIRNHVEQDGAGVPDQPVQPARDHKGPHDAGQRIHPEPPEYPRENEPDDQEDRDGGVGGGVNDGGSHIVVPMRAGMAVVVLLEHDAMIVTGRQPNQRGKRVRLGNFVNRLQVSAGVAQGEPLTATVGS